MKTFSENDVICNILLIDWIVGIINSILKHPLDTPEWSVKKYPIFIPRSEVPPLEMKSSNQLSQIRCCSLDEYFDQLVWIFKLPKVSIPILVNSGFQQPMSIPILAVCKSNKCVNIFTKKKNTSHYILKKKFCSGECPTVTTFLTYISPLSPNTQLKTVSTEGVNSSTSMQPQDTDPSNLEQFLAKHILDSSLEGMSSVLVRMDRSGFLHDMKKITLEDNLFTLRNFVIKKQTQVYPVKSEGYQSTSAPCSEFTNTKLKERLQGKDAAIVISENDANNSFLEKSEGEAETTEYSRKIPEKSHKDETTEDNTDMFETLHTEDQQTQENTHLSETSEMRDEIKEDYTGNSNTFGTEGETTQDGTHISETSEMQDQTETQDQTEIEFQIQIRNPSHTQGSMTQDQTNISQREDLKEKAQGQHSSYTQGSTTEDQTNILDREDRKKTAQGQDSSHTQGSTTEDHTKISHREHGKRTAQLIDVSHRQGSSTQYHTKVWHREDRKQRAQGQVSHRQGSTTERNTMVSDREDRKETAQGQVSHRQSSTTKNKKMVSDTEDRKEAAQGQVSHRQSSTSEDNTKVSQREDGKETAQGQVSYRQCSSTEKKRELAIREDGKEEGKGRLSQGQSSTNEKKRMVLDREDEEETVQGQVSQGQSSTSENNREITNREHEKEVAQGRVSHREVSKTEDNTEEETLKQNRGISVKEDNQLIPNRNKEEDRFNNNSTVAENFRSSDSKEVRTNNPGGMNYHSTPQSTAQITADGNNPTASWFPLTNMNTSTPVNEASFPFMDSMMDNLYNENVMRNFSVQPAPSGNPTSTIFANANSILYGMDNYVNDVPQQSFHSTEECNIGNNIKIRISIDSKIPVEISQEQEQHGHMSSNSFCKTWQNDSTLTNSLHHGKDPSTDDKGIRGTSEIGINCKPYKVNMNRHGKYSFTKTGDDKLPEVETPEKRRDSLDSYCQTPIDWKEQRTYDINNLLQDTSTEKSTKYSRKNNLTSLHLIEKSRPIKEHIQQTKWKQVSREEIKDNQQESQSIKWKKATNEYIKGKEVISKSSERKPSLELKKKTFRRSGETERSRKRNDTFDKAKNEISWNDRKNEVATIKGASKRRDRRSGITRNEDNNVTIDSTDDNDADDEEDESANLQTNEETEQPSDQEEINQFTSSEKQFQETNNTEESNDDSDDGSEEGGSVRNEDKGDRQVEDERDDEAAEEEADYQDEDEEEDDEGEDTQSIKTYVKSTIRFDDDDERNPHATSSPKGNIQLCCR